MQTNSFSVKKHALLKLDRAIKGTCELLICAASYEDRCLSIPLSISTDENLKTIILKNDDVAGTGHENAEHISRHFLRNVSVVEITKKIAIRTADRISKEIAELGEISPARICIDTTCMTHETLLVLFSLLRHMFPTGHREIRYMYCPAMEYDPGTPYEEKWLSRGIKDVRSILGYPGTLLPSKKNRLLVLVGFEVNRASDLIDVYEPASLGLGYGDGSLNSEHQLVNEQKHKRLSITYPKADVFQFSSSDAYSVRDFLINQVEKHNDFNLIVAPMNSKISTIGAALATFTKPEIQLCYAPAATYNFQNYSKSEDYCLVFCIRH